MRKALLAFGFRSCMLFAFSDRRSRITAGAAYDTAHPLTMTGTVKDFYSFSRTRSSLWK